MAKSEELKIIVSAEDLASRILQGIQKDILSIGAAYLSWTGVKEIIGGIKNILGDMISQTLESEKIWHNLSAALHQHGYAVEDNIRKTHRLGDSLLRTANISDEDYARAIQNLIDRGMKLADTERVIQDAADLASGTEMDFRTALDLVARASDGVVRGLKMYLGTIDESLPTAIKFEKILKLIEERFGGRSIENMNTASAALEQLSKQWGEFLETQGKIWNDPTKNVAYSLSESLSTLNKILDRGSIESFKELLKGMADNLKQDVDNGINPYIAALMIWFQKTKLLANEQYDLASANNVTLKSVKDDEEALKGLKRIYDFVISGMYEAGKASDGLLEKSKRLAAEGIYRLTQEYYEFNFAQMEAQNKLEAASTKQYLDIQFAQYVAYFKRINDRRRADAQAAEQMQDQIVGSMNNAISGIVGIFFGSKQSLADIFKGMAQDFITLFLQEILKSAVIAAAKLVSTLLIFDVPENDRRAAQSGRDYARHFISGITEGMNGFQPQFAGNLLPISYEHNAGGGTSANNNISFYSVGLTRDFINKEVIPVIQRAGVNRQTKIAYKKETLTGHRYGFVN